MSEIYRSESSGQLLRDHYRNALQHWPVDNEQLRFPTPEGETFVVACGPVTAPPLVLHGSKRRLEATVPHATVRLLPDVGHFVPAQTAAELEFLVAQQVAHD